MRVLEEEAAADEAAVKAEYDRLLEDWQRRVDNGETDGVLVIDGRESTLLPALPGPPPGDKPGGGWFFQNLLGAVPSTSEFFKIDRENAGDFRAPDFWPYPQPEFTREQIEAESWAEFQYPTWSTVARMLLLGNAALDHGYRDFDGWNQRFHFPPEEASSLTVPFCAEVEQSRLLCIEAVGTAQHPRWTVRLAAQVAGETVGAKVLQESRAAMAHLPCVHGGDPAEETSVALACRVGHSLLFDRMIDERRLGSAAGLAPYAPVGQFWSAIELDQLPISVRRFDPQRPPLDAVRQFLGASVERLSSGTISVTSDTESSVLQVQLPELDQLNAQLRELSATVANAQVGVSAVRLAIQGGLRDVLSGGVLKVEALDPVTNTWRPVDTLSEGQRSWVGFFLSVALQDDRSSTVLLADEVDQGMAERAVAGLLLALERLYPVIVATSHSPAALRAGVGELRHVARTPQGNIVVASPTKQQDARAMAQSLGVSISDMLSMLGAVVVVRDDAQREVVSLILESFSWRSNHDVAVAAAGEGFDSRFLLEWTDAGVVFVGELMNEVGSSFDGRVEAVATVPTSMSGISSAAVAPLLDAIERVAFRSRLAVA
jgi:hypothetical protein